MLKDLPLDKVYQFIEPGPVLLLTTQAPHAKPNVMPMSWHMMLEFEPPLIACVVSEGNYSFKALRETEECVLAVPPAELVETVTALGNCTGKDTDKFGIYNLTPLPAAHVAAPLVGEAIVNLECKIRDSRMIQAYDMFILECVKAWQNPRLKEAKTLHHHGFGHFAVDGAMIKVKSKMR
jgi:flavin reductase (DIM6/NTAB) family NADH-FMN oxidoreductase RutF